MREKGDTHGVCIAFMHPGDVDGNFCNSLILTLLEDSRGKGRITKFGCVLGMESSPRIAAGRNSLVEQFLDYRSKVQVPPEWLIFIDADMVWEPEMFDRFFSFLEKHDKVKVLGGLCFAGGRSAEMYPTLYQLVSKDPVRIRKLLEYPSNRLVKVNATGAAFLAIHHSVLEDMKGKFGVINGKKNPMIWFRDGTSDGHEIGEDIFFCLQAQGAGHDVYVHTGFKVGHIKRYNLNEEYYAAKSGYSAFDASGDDPSLPDPA